MELLHKDVQPAVGGPLMEGKSTEHASEKGQRGQETILRKNGTENNSVPLGFLVLLWINGQL